jgi:hypothetical protein
MTRGVRFSRMYVIGLRDGRKQNQQNAKQRQHGGAGRNTGLVLADQQSKNVTPLSSS